MQEMKENFIHELKDNEQLELFEELEMPLSLVLAEMEAMGIKVDKDRLEEMGKDLSEKLDEIEQKIHELAGEPFNINSPKQLGVILFEKLELPPVKKQKQAIQPQQMFWKS